MKPLITVIVPVYNVEKYIKKCVDSILHQTYSNLEIILVDDSSPDNCPIICDEYARKDKRVKVIHQQNSGQSAARNAALDIANGEYISFVDSDDYISPLFLEKLYNRIIVDKSDLAVCEYNKVDESGDIIHSKNYLRHNMIINEEKYFELEAAQKYYMFCVALWNKLFKSKTWKDLRLKDGKYAEDSFAMTKYISEMEKISIISEPLYYYCQRKDSAVNCFTIKNLDGVESRLERCKYYAQQGYHKQLKGSLLQCMGMLAYSIEKLDMRIPENKERYQLLKKQYDVYYARTFRLVEPNNIYLRCTLFFMFDRLYSKGAQLLHKLKH